MGSLHEKFSDKTRAKLFEHLVNCSFLSCTKRDCPIWKQRKCLSTQKKYAYTMKLSAQEIECILAQYECRYEKRLSDLDNW